MPVTSAAPVALVGYAVATAYLIYAPLWATVGKARPLTWPSGQRRPALLLPVVQSRGSASGMSLSVGSGSFSSSGRIWTEATPQCPALVRLDGMSKGPNRIPVDRAVPVSRDTEDALRLFALSGVRTCRSA